MTTREESLQDRIASLESRWSSLQDDLALSAVNDQVENVDTTIATLPVALQQVRDRGYVFRSFLERKTQVLQEQWSKMRAQVTRGVQDQARQLRSDAAQVDALFSRLRAASGRPTAAAGLAGQVESALSALESKARAAQSSLTGTFDELKNNVDQTKHQVDEIQATLERVAQGCFQLLAGEDIVLAVEAQWDRDGKEDPKGVLYLSDGRVLFERKEEVAKKKVLFIATEKELVQELQLEVALGDVAALKATGRGLLGREDWLEFDFQGAAPLRQAAFHIWYESKDWQALFGRVKSGEIAQERIRPKAAAVLEAVRNAPTKCGTCGASIAAQITKGMTQLTCEYCGSVIRL